MTTHYFLPLFSSEGREASSYRSPQFRPYQSGSYNATERHITKRGNKYLRKVIFEVCLSYIQHKPEGDPVYEFIEKKRSEGKCGKEALVAGINKFLRVYYGKVTELYRELEL